MKIGVVVFRVVAPCSLVGDVRRLEGAECLVVLEMASTDRSTRYSKPLTAHVLHKQYLEIQFKGFFVSEFVKAVQSAGCPGPCRLNEQSLEC